MSLTQGDIVIAVVRPPRGDVKRRPAVVVTPTPLLAAASTIQIVGISTSYLPDDPNIVPLGWRADGRIHTRLRRDSAVTANLIADVSASDLEPTGGYLSRAELVAVLDMLKRLAGN